MNPPSQNHHDTPGDYRQYQYAPHGWSPIAGYAFGTLCLLFVAMFSVSDSDYFSATVCTIGAMAAGVKCAELDSRRLARSHVVLDEVAIHVPRSFSFRTHEAPYAAITGISCREVGDEMLIHIKHQNGHFKISSGLLPCRADADEIVRVLIAKTGLHVLPPLGRWQFSISSMLWIMTLVAFLLGYHNYRHPEEANDWRHQLWLLGSLATGIAIATVLRVIQRRIRREV